IFPASPGSYVSSASHTCEHELPSPDKLLWSSFLVRPPLKKRYTNDKYHSSGLLSSWVSFLWREGRIGIRGRWKRRIFRRLGLLCGNENFLEGRLFLSRDLVINKQSLSKRGPSFRIRSRTKPLNNSSSEYSSPSIVSAIIHSMSTS